MACKNSDRITIITPTLNSENYILRNLESIHLSNSSSNPKQIIVDGLSTDRTIDIINNFRSKHNCDIQLIRKKDRNMYEALNNGLKEVETDYWSCLNSDDTYHTESLRNCLHTIKSKKAAYSVARCSVINEYNKHLYTIKPIQSDQTGFAAFGKCSALPQPSTIFHIKVRNTIGLFSETYRIAGDYDYALRACKQFTPLILDTILTNFLQRPDSISGSTNGSRESKAILAALNIRPTIRNIATYRLAFALKNISLSSLRRNLSLIKNLTTR